jgi:uncharacterized protein YqeY
MTLHQKITEDLKEAIKARDELRISSLRLLKAAVKNAQVEKRRELEDDEIQSIISSFIKKNTEAAEVFRKGDREDLARKEEEEIKILYQYLPKQFTSEEIEKILRDIISELSATGSKDLGKVMKAAMAKMAGQAQGKEVNKIAARLLK